MVKVPTNLQIAKIIYESLSGDDDFDQRPEIHEYWCRAGKAVNGIILADRKRIVEPLVKYKKSWNNTNQWRSVSVPSKLVDETLKLAGIGENK